MLSFSTPKKLMFISIASKSDTDDGDGGVGGNNNDDVDGIAMVDVVRDRGGGNGGGWIEGREMSRSMGQRGAKRTKGRHMNERSIDI